MVFLLKRDFEETIPGNRSVCEENLVAKEEQTYKAGFIHSLGSSEPTRSV
jgi:hypothetical protein